MDDNSIHNIPQYYRKCIICGLNYSTTDDTQPSDSYICFSCQEKIDEKKD